jgi:hypothetical protein
MRSEVIGPPSFSEMGDEVQVKALTESLPYGWKHGDRDRIDRIGRMLGAARDRRLYEKCGCWSWEEYCEKYLGDPAVAFDELIEGANILRGLGLEDFSEGQARDAAKQQQAAIRLAQDEKVMPLARHGEIGRGRDRGVINTSTRGTTNAPYLVARLKRDRPDIAERLANGEFRSVRAAAREAGMKVDTPPIVVLRRAWKRASPEEREAFLTEIGAA